MSVSVIEPGAVATEFVNNIGLDLEARIAAAGPYSDALRHYVERTVGQFLNGAQTPAGAAESVMEALTVERPAFRIQTSQWARDFTGNKLVDQDGSAVVGMTEPGSPDLPRATRPESGHDGRRRTSPPRGPRTARRPPRPGGDPWAWTNHAKPGS